jgi:penicillin-binding protein 2
VRASAPVVERQVALRPETLAAVRRALWGVVNEPGGTGASARVPGLWIAGKTGTAQVVGMPPSGSRRGAGREIGDHAWFVCFASGGTAQVAIAAIVEHAGHGGTESAPVARRLLAELKSLGYFDRGVAVLDGATGGEGSP